ncbi:MAG: ATP-binding protein [Lachnospiraceae bacterium]|nr:ATP-binding protein [Lachnospiraceae bacterium]
MKKDILSCFNNDKLEIEENKIKKIICAYSSTNIHVEQQEELKSMILGIDIEIIGLSTISHDLLVNFPFLAAEFLNIQVDTHQIFSIDEFIKVYDKNGMNAPLGMDLHYRELEKEQLYSTLSSSKITLVTGVSGVGKTRLVLEVCKQFEVEDWNVLCVKNNGELLYNDIQYYTSDEGKYILFIDDANQTTSLEYILDYVTDISHNNTIKIVMTVRDYAKHRVKSIVCQYMMPQEITIKTLKDEEVKEVLKENLGILNKDYLDRITQIAKGNIRLAILAGKISIDNGYLAIRNATDIFAQYYGRIIESTELTKDAINALFVISLLGAIRFKESVIAQKVLDIMNINSECFIVLCHDLNDRELIDLYQDEVAKVSDQSLGNYILEYVLIEKKTISIFQLLQISFPEYKNKIVYALNTLIKLFYSEDTKNYIEEQVNISWNEADKSQQAEYLKCFHALNEEKSLSILKQIIDSTKCIEMDISQFDIDSKKNYNNIKCEEIAILSSFKYSEYFEDAMELLLLYYKKRPDLIMDFYFAFSDRMSFDVNSHKLDYDKELKMVNCIWKYANEGKDINVTILLLHIFKELLKCSFHRTESAENSRSFKMYNLQVLYTDGIKKLRNFIWGVLSKLYSNNKYIRLLNDIISYCYISGLNHEEAKQIQLYDLQCIKEMFFDKWENLTFEQCKILRELEKHCEWMEIENGNLFDRYTENKDFIIYNTLVKEHINGKTWEEHEAERKSQIKEMIKEYQINDYAHLFKICRICEENKDKEGWSLKSGIDIIFTILESEPEVYLDVVNSYLQYQAPYGDNADRIISKLLMNFGIEHTKKIIEEKDFSYKHHWESAIWENAPKEMLNKELTKEFLNFMKQEASLEMPDFPSILCLERYREYDEKIVKKVSKIIIDSPPKNSFYVAKFFNFAHQETSIQLILDLFLDEWELLGNLYILALGEHFDYNGRLLIELVKRKNSFWRDITQKLHGNIHRTSYEHNVFENIWEMDSYKELIQIAFENMLGDYFGFMVEDEGAVIFANSKETSEFIRKRKKEWIKEYIEKNIGNSNNLIMIFDVIATFLASDRIEFLLELLNYTKDIEVFKSIPLFASSSSWSGSEVPLIEKKIDFLSDLIASLKGADFIEHRAYLKERKNSYESYKQEILIKEYLENSDIA